MKHYQKSRNSIYELLKKEYENTYLKINYLSSNNVYRNLRNLKGSIPQGNQYSINPDLMSTLKSTIIQTLN